MSEPVRIVVVLEGGAIQGVYTAGVPVEYAIIDYDTDDAHVSEVEYVPQGPGPDADTAEGVVAMGVADAVNPWIADYLWAQTETDLPAADDQMTAEERAGGAAVGHAAASAETFTRSKMAGYEVEEVEAGQWVPFRPDRIEFGAAYYATEREAWEACDRHRMFGDGDRREA